MFSIFWICILIYTPIHTVECGFSLIRQSLCSSAFYSGSCRGYITAVISESQSIYFRVYATAAVVADDDDDVDDDDGSNGRGIYVFHCSKVNPSDFLLLTSCMYKLQSKSWNMHRNMFVYENTLDQIDNVFEKFILVGV